MSVASLLLSRAGAWACARVCVFFFLRVVLVVCSLLCYYLYGYYYIIPEKNRPFASWLPGGCPSICVGGIIKACVSVPRF